MNNIWKRTLMAVAAALAIVGGAVSARAADDMGNMDHGNMPKNQPAKGAKNAGQTIEMKVTDKGFEPASVTVKKGQPVTLVITRVTDKTCAKDIVIDEHDIKTTLPLNKAVKVTFTPKKAGELKYGCAMDKMVGGVLSVQ